MPETPGAGPGGTLRRAVPALAGPLAIVVSVLVVLHLFAFSGLVSRQNPDLLALWLPQHCLLGTSLAAGHIPAWNPYVMGGTPFAADPQSGWMYAPVMLLYSTLGCGTALRWFVVLQPILAGLGIYWFARGEGLSRVAATVGGLALALPLAGSGVVLSLPFSATIAWTAFLLAAASRLMRASTWPGRLGWLALTALAWGQLAAAHLSNGLVMGTGALVVYLVARGVADVRAGRRTGRDLLAMAGLLVLALPLVNLAYFLPRLVYLPRTSLGLGYDRLQSLSRTYSHGLPPVGQLPGGAVKSTEPLRYVASPGLYLGAAALALTFAGWRARQRYLAIGFALFGATCYVLSLDAVAEGLAPHIRTWPLADFYLREPSRFSFGVVISVAVLAAVGAQAWREARSWHERVVMVAPAVGVWLCLPLAFHADVRDLRLFFVGAGVAAIALALSAYRPALLLLIPAALAGELLASGLAGQTAVAHPEPEVHGNQKLLEPLYPLLRPDIHIGDYLRPGPIALALQRAHDGRYLSIYPDGWDNRGLHTHQDPRAWGLMATQRSMLFGIEEAQGYNATQERRYWVFLRAVDPRRIKYNAAYLMNPVPVALRLLQVGWIVAPTNDPPKVMDARPTVQEGQWTLYRIPSSPRAEVAQWWTKDLAGGGSVLLHILGPHYDPSRQVFVEGRSANGRIHGFKSPRPVGTADYRWLSPQEATIDVRSSTRLGIVLIHNTYDPNWHAEVDGRPVPLLHADYLLQGVAVGSGHHTILLRYDDPTIGYGLLGSALALLALLGTAVVLQRRRRAPPSASVAESAADADAGRPLLEAP